MVTIPRRPRHPVEDRQMGIAAEVWMVESLGVPRRSDGRLRCHEIMGSDRQAG